MDIEFILSQVYAETSWRDLEDSDTLTLRDATEILAESIKSILSQCCLDCNVGTMYIDEYYMVTNDLWNAVVEGDGMLCIGCLEKRIGRLLTKEDFSDAPLNQLNYGVKSDRLLSRLS